MPDGPTPDRWRQLDKMLEEALELEPAARVAFLLETCAGDDSLRAEVEVLLQAEAAAPTLLDRGAIALAAPDLGDLPGPDEPAPLGLSERLGPYRIAGEIGAGGMSRVYLAERDDGEFLRRVAIKVMKTGTTGRAEYERRFRAERQILASFDHPEIARVYDGGVAADGRPYLVMEYIAGQPLTTYCDQRNLQLEERLELFVRVCGAVHYAHQRLVVHRDLKPSNILVTDEGRVKLLDFGIAKLLDPEAPGIGSTMPPTRTGLLLLTPEYAAPEQLLGTEITTATDVYVLGILLYELLTGLRPFQLAARTTSQMAYIVCEEDPKKPSTAAAEGHGSLPASRPWFASRLVGDLDTVVLEALHKEPHRRYSSARELADELERFLAGEPVLARPVGVIERLLRKARRHKRGAAAAAAAVALLAVFGALTLHTRLTAGREAVAAQRFGQEVERIEALLQRAYLAPLHDVRPELDEVRRRMTLIEAEMTQLGGTAQDIGHYALGRGHLGLGEERAARVQLERAWESASAEPRIAYALGLTLSRLYRTALDELPSIASQELRQARRREIERELRDPAVKALEAAGVEAFEAEFVAASLDFFAGQPEKAVDRLADLSRASPWFYQADLLAGDIHWEIQRSAADSGRKAEARQAQDKARAAFLRAIEVGRSDPRGHEGLCKLQEDVLRQNFHGTREGLDEARAAAIISCSHAVEVNADRMEAHLRLGGVERRWADYQQQLGHDPRPFLEEGRLHSHRAAESAPPGDSRAWVILGALFRVEGTYLAERGEDPTEAYSMAVSSYERALEIDPRDDNASVSRCMAELYLGDFERRRGGDAERHFENAIAAAQRAVELVPSSVGGHVNLGIAYEQLGIVRRDRGGEALPLFEAGAEALYQAIELNPEFYVTPFNLGQLLIERAELELSAGEDPTASVREAHRLLAPVLSAWSDHASVRLTQARGDSLLARWARAKGGDPRSALAAAKESADRGAAISSSDPENLVHAARIHLLDARWRQDWGDPSEPAISQALDLLDRALSTNPRLATAHRLTAEAHWLQARELVARSKGPRQALEAGFEAAKMAVEENPADAESHLQMALLEEQWAAWLTSSDQDPSARIAAAGVAVGKALELRPGYRSAEEMLRRLQGR